MSYVQCHHSYSLLRHVLRLKPNSLSFLLVLLVFQSHVLVRSEFAEINTKHIQPKQDVANGGEDILIQHDDIKSQSGLQTLKVGATEGIPPLDTNGYIIFCPCMGRFGNQMEQMIGGLSFAKMLNRTLILPPLREDLASFTKFTDWFQVDPILEFHRVIKGEDFMQHYGESYWPAGRRNGYCRDYVVDNGRCRMKYGLPHSAFWDYLNVDFDGIISFDLIDEVDLSLESEVKLLRKQWIERFPSSEHPVLAMYNVPGSFPSLPGNKIIQKYIKWNSSLLAEADKVKKMLFGGEKYLGIHLRVGEDWDRVCQTAVGVSSMYFASPQCKSSNHGRIFQEMCYPSVQEILDLTKEAIMTFDLRHLYIASDDNPYKEEFKATLHALNVTVHHYNPTSPHLDLIMLGEADYFIGNCISTFTSFIKRERDVRGRSSTFWGYPV